MRPLHDLEPLRIILADGRAERLLGDDVGQDDRCAGLGEPDLQGVELRRIGCQCVAAPVLIGLDHVVGAADFDDPVLDVVGRQEVDRIVLVGRARLRADLHVSQFERRHDGGFARHEEALPVVVGNARELQPQRGLTTHGPGGVSGEDVDLALLQRIETGFGRQRLEADLVRVVENRGGDGAAEVDIEAAPLAGRVGLRKAGETLADAAAQRAARLDRSESGLRMGSAEGCGKAERGDRGGADNTKNHGRSFRSVSAWKQDQRGAVW